MERGQIVALPTVVIPPENTPTKRAGETLLARPRWKYVGPADTIRLEWQIGRWGWAGFAGETERKYKTLSQPASLELKEFYTYLPAISVTPLSISDDPYDCEIWFKDKFSDVRIIVENCVRITPLAHITQILNIIAPSSAYAGTEVNVEIVLRNLHTDSLNMWPGRIQYDSDTFYVYDAAGAMHVVVPAGATHSWFGSFTMPNKTVVLYVESWYQGGDGVWHPDVAAEKTIRLF